MTQQIRRKEDDDMSGYVQLGDVHAYYEEDGDGEPLVLLYPGLADSRAFEEIRPSHTLALYRGLPDAQLAVLPGTGHGGIDTRIVIDFLTAPQEGTGR
jgi:hypothetical protein